MWTLVVPLKPLSRAKSRLSDAAGDALRPGLALAFAKDTVGAALAGRRVVGVTVVTDDPLAGRELAALGALVLPDTPGRGLNAALAHGARTVREGRPRASVAALNADLPALRTADLDQVLEAAAGFPRAFLADAAGVGTTLLAAAPGTDLAPAFGAPPGPGTGRPARTRSSCPGSTRYGATWTPGRICARRWRWAWAPTRPGCAAPPARRDHGPRCPARRRVPGGRTVGGAH